MPKKEIKILPGQVLPLNLRVGLLEQFGPKDLEKLERLGGRILLSISAPYVPARSTKQEKKPINDTFIAELRSEAKNSEKLLERLQDLDTKQLKEICVLIRQPIRSRANRSEMSSEILRNLRAESYWHAISTPRAKFARG